MMRLGRAAPLGVVAALALAGCGGGGPITTASGKTTTTRVDAAGATRLDVADGFDVKVTVGRPETAVVTYDDNLGGLLDVGMHGGVLRVHLKPHGVLVEPTLRADVTVQRLESIQTAGGATVAVSSALRNSGLQLGLSGGSRITAELELDRVDAKLSGGTRLTLTGTAGTLTADGSGASELALDALRLHDLDIHLSGASHADVQADGTIAAQLSGASVLTYRGNPRFAKRETSGASTIQAK
jgi:Putative auto-transporter adhesin, head GIN domain